MARFSFPSIECSLITAYVLDTLAYNEKGGINGPFRHYDTYGDGMTAHSPDIPIQADRLIDYLYSFAAWLQTHPEAVEHGGIATEFQNPHADSHIAFAASVRFQEKGTRDRYYSMNERKMSSSPAKSHDRRYERIESWMNGTYDAVTRLFYQSYHGPWDRFKTLYWVRAYLWKHPDDIVGYADHAAIGMEWTHDNTRAMEFDTAYEAVLDVIAAIEATDRTKRRLEAYRNRVEFVTEAKNAE